MKKFKNIAVGDIIKYEMFINGVTEILVENVTNVTDEFVATYRCVWKKSEANDEILAICKPVCDSYICVWRKGYEENN